jgi:hypothetical protein
MNDIRTECDSYPVRPPQRVMHVGLVVRPTIRIWWQLRFCPDQLEVSHAMLFNLSKYVLARLLGYTQSHVTRTP